MRRRGILAAAVPSAVAGCLSTSSPSESDSDPSETASETTTPTTDRRNSPPDAFQTVAVEQSPPDSPVVETAVGVERQATPESPAVIHATYRYTGETSQRTRDWGSPLPFHRGFAADSPLALVPPRGFGARPYSKRPERIENPEGSWTPDDDDVVLDGADRPCWRAEENLFSPDDSPNVDLAPGTTMTQYYWVVAVARLSGTCLSPGRYTHAIDRVPPTDDPWSITVTITADR